MNKHHSELIQQFQQLMDVRNELKESLDTKITSQNENKLPCFIEIDRWERKTIERIRDIARKVRTNIKEIMAKNAADIRYQLEQLSTNMQKQEKEGNYLENDIERMKLQMDQLRETIQHVNEKIQVIPSNNINWDTLIYVNTDKNVAKDCHNSSECLFQHKFSANQEKQSNTELTSRHHNEEKSRFRPVVRLPFQSIDSKVFRPISSPVLLQEDSSDSDRNSPLFQNIIPPDRIVPMLSTQGESSSWTAVPRNRQNM
jgi:DNA repair exonuclease SbcCD ATPase subunit